MTTDSSQVPDQSAESIEPSEDAGTSEQNIEDRLPSDVSNISSVADVPLITLNNGVQVPQFGLGTQIQRLEQDASADGRQLLNQTSHDAVVAALQAGYRHLDTAHGYFNERGVGQGILDSGVSREEIWVTSKLWPSEYGAMNFNEYQVGNMLLNFRFGMFNPDYPNPLNKESFALVYDCFTTEPIETMDEVLRTVVQGHDAIQELFETSITDALRKVLNHEIQPIQDIIWTIFFLNS